MNLWMRNQHTLLLIGKSQDKIMSQNKHVTTGSSDVTLPDTKWKDSVCFLLNTLKLSTVPSFSSFFSFTNMEEKNCTEEVFSLWFIEGRRPPPFFLWYVRQTCITTLFWEITGGSVILIGYYYIMFISYLLYSVVTLETRSH